MLQRQLLLAAELKTVHQLSVCPNICAAGAQEQNKNSGQACITSNRKQCANLSSTASSYTKRLRRSQSSSRPNVSQELKPIGKPDWRDLRLGKGMLLVKRSTQGQSLALPMTATTQLLQDMINRRLHLKMHGWQITNTCCTFRYGGNTVRPCATTHLLAGSA
jgi:hypothetical protein